MNLLLAPLLPVLLVCNPLSGRAEPAASSSAVSWAHTYDDGTTIKEASVAEGIVRVKTVPRGAQEEFSSVDLTLPQPHPAPVLTVTNTATGWTLATAEVHVHVSSAVPTADVTRPDGTILSQERAPPARVPEAECGDAHSNGGFIHGGCLRATRSLQDQEELFGGGVQLYSGPAQRGKKLFLRTNALVGADGWSHTVAPLFFSSRGYGFLVNTHAYTYFDIGATDTGRTVTPPPPGTVCDTKYADPLGGNTSALSLRCPAGGKIAEVLFANYGLPTGDCGSFKADKACSQDRTAAIKKLCLGKPECSAHVSNQCEACPGATCTATCGDPCWGNNQKHLSVSVLCKGQPVQPPTPAPPTAPGANLIHVADPVVDMFFFAGPSNHAVLAQFTALTGRMSMPPKWAMGLWYHPQEHSNQSTVLEIVDSFAQNHVPLAALTLEPPWQTHAYSCSYVWNPAMFWDPKGFVKTLATKDVQVTLWEHGYVFNGTSTASGSSQDQISPLFVPLLENDCAADWITWGGLTPDFTLNKTKDIYKAYHTKTFLDIGIAGFKLDECDGNPGQTDPGSGHNVRWFFPDNASFPSGMSGAQMHNIFGASYGKLFHEMYREAGTRTFLKARAMYVGSQAEPTTFYSDSYDYPNYLLGVVNSGFGGWVWAPETRSATSNADFARRAQLMLFSGLASMDGWNTGFVPWNSSAVDADSAQMFADYTQERAKLQPFLYGAYQRQGLSGIPVCRALMVDYDNDTAAFTIEDQYLLGDGLMVAPVVVENSTSRSVHFPAGDDWVDYWSHGTKSYHGGSDVIVPAPLTTLPLFQRKGSVVPKLDLDDERMLVLQTHAEGASHQGFVYDDDGISTKAELHGQYFRMATETSFASSVELTLRVEHADWQPRWQRVRWEVGGPSVGQWQSVRCSGADLPRVQALGGGLGTASWAVEGTKAVVALPIVAKAGWEVRCIAQ